MSKGKILIVDDEENICGSLQGILTDEGYDVSVAKDGEAALRMIRSEAPDLILLDIWIPGIDGIQTLEILKNMGTESEVVMMSGHGAIDTAVKATKLGAFDFIEKPFSLDSILRTVSSALDNKRHRMPREPQVQYVSLESWLRGPSKAARDARTAVDLASSNGGPVLLTGEPGVGKKVAARLIHEKSEMRDRPFVSARLGQFRIEDFFSIVFGGKGDGVPEERGEAPLVEQAGGGVLFLDRIDLLPGKAQRKLSKKLAAASGPRIIASSLKGAGRANRGGGGLIKELAGYFGANVIELAPLSGRKMDIPELVRSFVVDISRKYGKKINSMDDDLVETLLKYKLRGNTDELYSVIELAVLACEDNVLSGGHIVFAGQGARTGGAFRKKTSRQSARPGSAGDGACRGRFRQRTLHSSVVLCGQGLHSGLNTGLILSPLPPDSGIVFSDISSGGKVAAGPENVISTEYSTTLSNDEVIVKTVEHIMSALSSYMITNLLVKIGDEAPIMDGSAIDFCNIIENGGIEEQNAWMEPIVIDRKITVGDPEGGPSLTVEPSGGFSIRYNLEYPPPVGAQEHEYVYEGGEHYRNTIAPARTFGFLKDIKQLEDAGLASGGKLSNVVLIDSEKVINTPLRFSNEPARHKILDLIGDLYLLGRPVKGRFTATKSGHTQNIAMVREIQKRYLRQSRLKKAGRA